MLQCSWPFGRVFAVGEFSHRKRARLHWIQRLGHVLTVSELNGEKGDDTLVVVPRS
jgi:hypothetical protein